MAPNSPHIDLRSSGQQQMGQAMDVQRPVGTSTPSERRTTGGIGVLGLLLAYMWLDLLRPSFTWHFPKIIAPTLFVLWLVEPDKRWPRQIVCMLIFLGVMFIDTPIAANTYEAVWTSYGMANLILMFCLPLATFINSLDRLRVFVNSLIAIYVVIGTYACFNQGYGPAGAAGGQDENYVSACMAMIIPLTVYSSFAATSRMHKLLYLAPVPVLLLAVLLAENPSRGAFLGILSVLGYFVLRAKKRVAALVGVGVFVLFIGLQAGTTYWAEMETISDTSSGTADVRLDLWSMATRMFIDHPISGVGPSNFRWRTGEYQSQELFDKYGRSLGGSVYTHSLYFELIAELGLAGAILFALILARNFGDLWGGIKRLDHVMGAGTVFMEGQDTNFMMMSATEQLKLLRCYADGLTACLLAFLVSSVFLSTLYYSWFWIFSALIASFKCIVDGITSKFGVPQQP